MLIYTFFLSWNMRPNKGNSDDDNDVSGNFKFYSIHPPVSSFVFLIPPRARKEENPPSTTFILSQSTFFRFFPCFVVGSASSSRNLSYASGSHHHQPSQKKETPSKKKPIPIYLIGEEEEGTPVGLSHTGVRFLSLRKKKRNDKDTSADIVQSEMEEEEVEVVFFLFSNDVINPKPERNTIRDRIDRR